MIPVALVGILGIRFDSPNGILPFPSNAPSARSGVVAPSPVASRSPAISSGLFDVLLTSYTGMGFKRALGSLVSLTLLLESPGCLARSA